MYKPNFCAECGAQVVRAEWHVWTSRRFCQPCARRFRQHQLVAPIVAAAFIFCAGLLIGRVARTSPAYAPPPLIIEHRNQNNGDSLASASLTSLSPKDAAPSSKTESTSNTLTASPNSKAEAAYGKDGTAAERPTDPNEVISICGARTQKGTPCQRRVRGTGRCWQHTGMAAIIPLQKRILTGM